MATPLASYGASGKWTMLSGGNASGTWSDPLNWDAGVIADGAGFTANFSTLDVTSSSTIQLDSPRTIGSLLFGDTDVTTPANWILSNNSNPANVLTFSGTPTITTNGAAGSTLTISTIFAGTEGLTLQGTSTMLSSGTIGHTYTGGTVLRGRLETTNLANANLTVFGSAVATNTVTFDGGYFKIFNTTGSTSAGTLVNNLIVNTTGTLEYSGRSFSSGTLTGSGSLDVVTHVTRSDNGGNWSGFTGTINLRSGDAGVADFRQTTYSGFAGATLNLGVNSNLYFTLNQANTTNPYGGTNVDIGALAGASTGMLRGGPIAGRVTSFRVGAKNVDTEFAGSIVEQTAGALTNLVKNGTGNLTLSGKASAYNGPTTINAGTLTIASIANGGAVSSIGQSTNAAANLVINGGTLRYTGAGDNTDRLMTIGALGATLDNSGTGGITFSNTGNLTFSGGAVRTLTLTGSNVQTSTLNPVLVDDVGATSVVKSGAGTWALAGTNTYSGATTINGGILSTGLLANGGVASGIGLSSNAASNLVINGGALRYTGAATTTDRSFTVGTNGATLDGSGAGAVVFSNPAPLPFSSPDQSRTITLTGTSTANNQLGAVLANGGAGVTSLAKTGSGTWVLSADNTFTGTTTVSGGTLKLNNATGSATGTGPVQISSSGTLGGTGTASGAVTVASGGHLAPGDFGVGKLTVGSLSISTGVVLDYEFSSANGNDLLAINLPGGLTLNGAGFNLFTEGTQNRWTTPGVYNLFQYTGALGGTGTAGLSVLNPQSGINYAFGNTGSFVTLTISATSTISSWTNTAGGSWNTAGNWSSGIPNAQNDTATFGSALTAAAGTVTLDGNKTAGTVQFDNLNSYTVAAGTSGTLTLNSSGGNAQIVVLKGSHTISAPVSMANATTADVNRAADILTLSGPISGAGVLTKAGPGTLVLSGNNTFAAGTSLTSGVLQLAHNNALGTGTLTVAGASTIRAGASALSVPNAVSIGSGVTSTVDTAGNALELSGVISGAANGALTKTGTGTLTVGSANTYTGVTNVTAGVLAAPLLTDGGIASSIGQSSNAAANLVIDNSALRYTGADTNTDRLFTVGANGGTIEASGTGAVRFTNTGTLALAGNNVARTLTLGGTNTADNTLAAVISNNGTGNTSLAKTGAGTWIISAANTHSGDTVISGGKLSLTNSLALQRSTLNYNNQGGVIGFSTLSAATLGGLSGSQALPLENEFGASLALTVGANNVNTTYSGAISGFGSVIKTGTGVLSLAGQNTYAGSTTITSGAIKAMITDALLPFGTLAVNTPGGLQLANGVTLKSSITAAVGSNEFVDVPDAGASATLAGSIGVAGGANQFRLGIGGVGSTLNLTGSINIPSAATITFLTRGNMVFAENAALNVTPGLTIGRATQATNVVFKGSALANIGGASGFGGGQANPNIALTIQDSAIFNLGVNTLDLNASTAGTNQTSLNLNGGTLITGGFFKTSTGANQLTTINFNGGVLKAGFPSATFLPTYPGLTAQVQAGGAKIDTDAYDIQIDQSLVPDPLLVTADGGLTKSGSGKLTLTGVSTYTGPTIVQGGTLLVSGSLSGTNALNVTASSVQLGGADRINDAAKVVLNQDASLFTLGFSDVLSTLGLGGDATIDLGTGASVLKFADSSSVLWSAGRLTIAGWSGTTLGSGTDQIFFGGSATGLTGTQLAQISFLDPAGFAPGTYGARLLSTGELVAVPEPASSAALALGVSLLAMRRRPEGVRRLEVDRDRTAEAPCRITVGGQ